MKMVLRSASREEDVFVASTAEEIVRRTRYWLELIEAHGLDYTIEISQHDPPPESACCAYCETRFGALERVDAVIDAYRCVDERGCRERVETL